MIGYKWKNEGNNFIAQLKLLWLFSVSIHHYIAKGDHLELSLGIGPVDLRFGTSIWWSKIKA
jgi:hypothetical protein